MSFRNASYPPFPSLLFRNRLQNPQLDFKNMICKNTQEGLLVRLSYFLFNKITINLSKILQNTRTSKKEFQAVKIEKRSVWAKKKTRGDLRRESFRLKKALENSQRAQRRTLGWEEPPAIRNMTRTENELGQLRIDRPWDFEGLSVNKYFLKTCFFHNLN